MHWLSWTCGPGFLIFCFRLLHHTAYFSYSFGVCYSPRSLFFCSYVRVFTTIYQSSSDASSLYAFHTQIPACATACAHATVSTYYTLFHYATPLSPTQTWRSGILIFVSVEFPIPTSFWAEIGHPNHVLWMVRPVRVREGLPHLCLLSIKYYMILLMMKAFIE